jgi:hypothetical protein
VFPVATAGLILLKVMQHQLLVGRAVLMAFAYFLFITIFIMVSWPYLWADPIGRFIEALSYMAKLDFPVKSLYMGDIYASNQLPWHYLPVWVGISTPPLYSFLFVVGTVAVCKAGLIHIWRALSDDDWLQDCIFLVFFWAPVLAIIFRGATLYDGWRHAYFVYPAFLLLAIKGFVELTKIKIYGRSIALLIILITITSLMITASWMNRNHPYQNVYFNFLAGKNWKDHFDVDYWGLSNRQALEYILEHDASESINVLAQNPVLMPLEMAKILIPVPHKNRIQVLQNTDKNKNADYMITNYRLTAQQTPDKDFELIHEIKVNREVIVSIYKRQP